MAKVAVFDRFYRSPEFHNQSINVIAPALDTDIHEVVSHSNTIGGSALAIVAMSEKVAETPDIVIVGGRLEHDGQYFREPAAFTKTITVQGRALWGKPNVNTKRVVTTLLPMPDRNGEMVLPTSYKSPVGPQEMAEFVDEMSYNLMASGCAAYVLSHLVAMLLPKEVNVIGVSSYNNMIDLPVSSVVDRSRMDAVDRLREAINTFS